MLTSLVLLVAAYVFLAATLSRLALHVRRMLVLHGEILDAHQKTLGHQMTMIDELSAPSSDPAPPEVPDYFPRDGIGTGGVE